MRVVVPPCVQGYGATPTRKGHLSSRGGKPSSRGKPCRASGVWTWSRGAGDPDAAGWLWCRRALSPSLWLLVSPEQARVLGQGAEEDEAAALGTQHTTSFPCSRCFQRFLLLALLTEVHGGNGRHGRTDSPILGMCCGSSVPDLSSLQCPHTLVVLVSRDSGLLATGDGASILSGLVVKHGLSDQLCIITGRHGAWRMLEMPVSRAGTVVGGPARSVACLFDPHQGPDILIQVRLLVTNGKILQELPFCQQHWCPGQSDLRCDSGTGSALVSARGVETSAKTSGFQIGSFLAQE